MAVNGGREPDQKCPDRLERTIIPRRCIQSSWTMLCELKKKSLIGAVELRSLCMAHHNSHFKIRIRSGAFRIPFDWCV